MGIAQLVSNSFLKKFWKYGSEEVIELYKEPLVTYMITPNNAPKKTALNRRNPMMDEGLLTNAENSDMIINTINGLFSKFYLPERIRVEDGMVKIKLNDIVSYKVVVQDKKMRFYLTMPKRWSHSFLKAIVKDWGSVDLSLVEERFLDFNQNNCKAVDIVLKHHYCLAIKHSDKNNSDSFYSSLASLGSSMTENEKLVVDFNIMPVGETWIDEAKRKYKSFKNGRIPMREEKNINGLISKVFEIGDSIIDEMTNIIRDLMDVKRTEDEKSDLWKPEYSDKKMYATSKGFNTQIRAIAESDDVKRTKHILKNVQSAFESLDGDNKFEVRQIRTKKGLKTVIKSVQENERKILAGNDIFFQKEISQFLRMPSNQTLKENQRLIDQDNFTRMEIHEDFLEKSGNLLAYTLEKGRRAIYLPAYEREWWTEKGRLALDKTKLDDNCYPWMIFGQQGSGKTMKIVRDICQAFATNCREKEEWKRKSKSVVAFDVADGEIITKVWNQIPPWLHDRVIILNHSVPERPVPVNFAELEEFNRKTMKDPDYAFKLAEMEAFLMKDILTAGDSVYVDNFFITALQIAHTVNVDWGYAEAIRILTDDAFRVEEVMPFIEDERLLLEMESYNALEGGARGVIVRTIQNRFTQLERDRKLWDCIAQKPLRDENGECKINFRKWLDGDEDGAYLVLVYIPKDGVSDMFRKFLFAHYLLKIWNVAISREKGFAGREYRPESLVVIDEVHQIIDVPIIADMFIDLFKEPRKYSLKLMFTLHGWSSIANAGRNLEKKIKQSILDNGCNLLMLKGGRDAFDSLSNFLSPMTVEDFDNLMNMSWSGIYGVRWQNKYHVFQSVLPEPIDKDKDFLFFDVKLNKYRTYGDWDLYDLAKYESPYSRDRDIVRDENLQRIRSTLKKTFSSISKTEIEDDKTWEILGEEVGGKEKR